MRSARSDSECSGISDLEKMRTIFDALLAYEEDDRVLSDVFYKLPSKYVIFKSLFYAIIMIIVFYIVVNSRRN